MGRRRLRSTRVTGRSIRKMTVTLLARRICSRIWGMPLCWIMRFKGYNNCIFAYGQTGFWKELQYDGVWGGGGCDSEDLSGTCLSALRRFIVRTSQS